jgi:molybdenum cofactor biosynthesis protein A
MLFDNHNRPINYLRLAVTDRCNLRCTYCMPEHGLEWLSRKELMSYEEMLRVCTMLVNMGIDKIRITGGEPFVRKDIMQFMRALAALEGLKQLNLTTNGVLTAPFIPEFKKLKIRSVNLSLDTLDRARFFEITRRDEFLDVMHTLDELLKYGLEVKINAVVMDGKNIDDILPLVEMTKTMPISVRFIEEMPFNGAGNTYSGIKWNFIKILETITAAYPTIQKMPDPPNATAYHYHIPNHKGTVGIIAAYTRSFCGTCNRIRLTPEGVLKTCLYGDGVLNVKDLMRENEHNIDLQAQFLKALQHRAKDGWEAERDRDPLNIHASMAMIGG